jgi:hypothetical protein
VPPTTTTTIPLDDREVPDVFRYTAPTAKALLDATRAAVLPAAVATRGQLVGTVASAWGGTVHRVALVTTRGALVAAWPGQTATVGLRLHPVPPGARSGTPVGTALFSLGTQRVPVPVALAGTVPEPDWWFRLVHGV